MSRPTRFFDVLGALALLATGAWTIPHDPAGSNQMPSTVSFADLMTRGRSLVMDRVPEQSRQSLPVPLRVNGALQVAFMYSPSQALPNLVRLAPPHFVAWLDPASGALVDVQEVTPQTFRQTHGAADLLGQFSLPPGIGLNEHLAQREHLFHLYEQLVPAWFADPRGERKDLRPIATDFIRTFALVSEPPLAPYYDSLGAEFFNWVRAIARPDRG
jgi:hypothetical protein